MKLLSGPLLASEPQAPPRALLLVLAALLVGPACGRKVAASALKAARALEAPLLAGLRGLAATAEAAEEAAGRQPKARKGGKKGDKAAEAGAAAADASKAAADAAYNGSVVAALAGAAGGSAAAAEQLAQLLAAVSGSSEPSGARAEVLLLLAAHAAVQSGGEGSGAVAAALLRALQPDGGAIGAAFQPAAVLPHESFGEGGLPSASLLQRSVDGHLGPASLHATAVLGALRCAPWPSLAPRDAKVLREGSAVYCLLVHAASASSSAAADWCLPLWARLPACLAACGPPAPGGAKAESGGRAWGLAPCALKSSSS